MNTDREHLDAETVAAWMDGGLDAKAVAAAEAHASNCDRCQSLLATLARTLPADQAAAAASESPVRFWKWLAPLGAAAAAVTVWMVVPQEPMQRPPLPESQREVAGAPASSQAPASAPAPAPQAREAQPAAPAATVADPRARAQRRDSEAKQTLADEAAANTSVAELRQEKQERALQEPLTAPAPPSPMAPPAGAARVAAAPKAAEQAAFAGRSAALEVASPDPQRRWRVIGGGIERTRDGGRTWVGVRQVAGERIVAGSAPVDDVCWLAGSAGLVLLTTDGTNFTPLPFPEKVDLVSVSATDARRATIVAADGRAFRTDDGGQNWRNP